MSFPLAPSAAPAAAVRTLCTNGAGAASGRAAAPSGGAFAAFLQAAADLPLPEGLPTAPIGTVPGTAVEASAGGPGAGFLSRSLSPSAVSPSAVSALPLSPGVRTVSVVVPVPGPSVDPAQASAHAPGEAAGAAKAETSDEEIPDEDTVNGGTGAAPADPAAPLPVVEVAAGSAPQPLAPGDFLPGDTFGSQARQPVAGGDAAGTIAGETAGETARETAEETVGVVPGDGGSQVLPPVPASVPAPSPATAAGIAARASGSNAVPVSAPLSVPVPVLEPTPAPAGLGLQSGRTEVLLPAPGTGTQTAAPAETAPAGLAAPEGRREAEAAEAPSRPADALAAASARPGAAAPLPPAAPAAWAGAPVPLAPLNEQLVRPVFTLASAAPGEHTLTLEVAPDNLGSVTVKAHIGPDGVRVELFAASDAGRDALKAILTDLKRDLAGQGLNATLDLSARSQPLSSNGDNPARDNATRDNPARDSFARDGGSSGGDDGGSGGSRREPEPGHGPGFRKSPPGSGAPPGTGSRYYQSSPTLDVLA